MTLHGTTTGRYGSPHRTQTLAGATLVFYPADKGADVSRWGWRSIPELPDGEVGRAVVQDDGRYTLDLDHDVRTFLVAAEVARLAYAPDTGTTALGLLGTGVVGGEAPHTLSIDLPARDYCDLLRALDLWLVAGRASDCGQPVTPAAGAAVTVFDRDLTQDDALGTDVADVGGSFEIFFPRSTFHQVPALPPPFDSILPHELIGGPDIYFQVELGGATLLDEDPSMGRTSGRENRPNCTFVELCVQPPDFPPQTYTLWSRIGEVAVPNSGGLNDFDADGLVDSGKLAFTGAIDFNGQISQMLAGQPVRYRFLFAEWADLGTSPSLLTEYAPLTATHITSAPYGAIYVDASPPPFDYTLTPLAPTPDADGWITVSQHPDFVRDTDRMIQLDTRTLVPAVDTSDGPSTAGAGDPVSAAQQDRPRKVSFMMQVQAGGITYQHPVPVVIHLNNSAAYARFDLQELTSNDCIPVAPGSGGGIVVHPMYTVGHPYLNAFTVQIQRQGGALVTALSDDHTAHGPVWTASDGEHDTIAAAYADVQPCSYRAWLHASRRLTTGYGGVGSQSLLRTFCTS